MVISKDQAELEINSWLDFKKISERKREAFKTNIDNMIEAIMEGNLSLNDETFVLTQTLKFPISDIKTFDYKPRIKVKEVQDRLQNIKGGGIFAQSFAYISALTGQLTGIVKELETEDYTLADHISVFFMM